MPELPEVETTRRGIAPYLLGRRLTGVRIRQPLLRWPVPEALCRDAPGQKILAVDRRAKYLLLRLERGTVLIHLGMSGSLRLLPSATLPGPHDHADLLMGVRCLRLRDPRRFGTLLWTTEDPDCHPRLAGLGLEPFDPAFDGDHLQRAAQGRRVAVKSLIMDQQILVGVGNIYASETLFRARIHPARPAHRISRERYQCLAEAVRAVLGCAIEQGGTSLRDFVREDGRPGYFAQSLEVYGRAGLPCSGCGRPIRERRIGQRSSFFCPHCQH